MGVKSGLCGAEPSRFGPQARRTASRLLPAYHPPLDVYPFAVQQVVDAGDVPRNPFSIVEAVEQIGFSTRELLSIVVCEFLALMALDWSETRSTVAQ